MLFEWAVIPEQSLATAIQFNPLLFHDSDGHTAVPKGNPEHVLFHI